VRDRDLITHVICTGFPVALDRTLSVKAIPRGENPQMCLHNKQFYYIYMPKALFFLRLLRPNTIDISAFKLQIYIAA